MSGSLQNDDQARVCAQPRDVVPTLGQYVLVAIKVSVIGCVAVATAECISAFLITAKYLQGGRWPIQLFAASLGKAAVTHLLVWCPLMLLCALATRSLIRKKRSASRPEPIFAAMFIALAGLVIVPADLALLGETALRYVVLSCGGIVLVAYLVYASLRVLIRLSTERTIAYVLNGLTCAALFVAAACGVVFVRSPLFNPGAFHVGTVARVAHSSEHLNVLWIVLDTVRADRMSVYGSDRDTTPFIRQWSSSATIFDRAVSSGMWTMPAHASMFTGLSLRQHGVDHDHRWLDESFDTVAEVLSAVGYRTAAFSGNPWVSRDTNLLKGFDVSRNVYRLKRMTRFSLESLCETWGITPPLPWLDRDFGSALANQMVGDWIEKHADGSAPFFLFVNYMDAHLPYISPAAYRRLFMTSEQVDRSYDLRYRVYGNVVSAMDPRFSLEGPDFISPEDRTVLKLQYEAAIRYLDDRIAELIGLIEQRGLLDNTLVVITSDHGEHLDTHGMWSHTFLAYADLTHVALIIRDPRGRAPRRITTPVQLGDLYQTVLNAALNMSETGPGFGAKDLLALPFEGDPDRVAISECGGPPREMREKMKSMGLKQIERLMQSQVTAQDFRYKLIVSGDGSQELYDLIADPGELRDLSLAKPDEVHRLASFVAHWAKSVPAYVSTSDVPELNPDVIRALRSLGYVGE